MPEASPGSAATFPVCPACGGGIWPSGHTCPVAESRHRVVRTPQPCKCPTAVRGLGVLHGVNMGRGQVRLSTTAGCPEHDTCHGWTRRRRIAYASTRPWSVGPYCPIHRGKDCPDA